MDFFDGFVGLFYWTISISAMFNKFICDRQSWHVARDAIASKKMPLNFFDIFCLRSIFWIFFDFIDFNDFNDFIAFIDFIDLILSMLTIFHDFNDFNPLHLYNFPWLQSSQSWPFSMTSMTLILSILTIFNDFNDFNPLNLDIFHDFNDFIDFFVDIFNDFNWLNLVIDLLKRLFIELFQWICFNFNKHLQLTDSNAMMLEMLSHLKMSLLSGFEFLTFGVVFLGVVFHQKQCLFYKFFFLPKQNLEKLAHNCWKIARLMTSI